MELKEFKQEKTLVVIKPDGIQRGLIGEIIKRFENVGLKLIAVKMTTLTPDFVEKHYTVDPEWRRITGEKTIKNYKDKGLIPPHDDPYKITEIILGNMKKYMSAGPVIAMILEGAHAIKNRPKTGRRHRTVNFRCWHYSRRLCFGFLPNVRYRRPVNQEFNPRLRLD